VRKPQGEQGCVEHCAVELQLPETNRPLLLKKQGLHLSKGEVFTHTIIASAIANPLFCPSPTQRQTEKGTTAAANEKTAGSNKTNGSGAEKNKRQKRKKYE
jgi:hypothetical protein